MNEYLFALVGPTTPGVPGLVIPGLVALSLFCAVVAGAFATVPRFGKFLVREPSERRFEEYSPFLAVESDGMTLRCKGGVRVRVWAVDGIDHETLGSDELDRLFYARFAMLNNFAKLPGAHRVRLTLATFRERVEEQEVTPDSGSGVEGEYLGLIGKRWEERAREGIYRNRHYLMAYGRGAGGMEQLGAIDGVLRASLNDYGPRLLSCGGEGDSPLAPFAAFLSPCFKPRPVVRTGEPVTPLIASEEVSFARSGMLRFVSGNRTRVCVVLGIRGLPDVGNERVIMELQRLNGEVLIAHSMIPAERVATVTELTREAEAESSVAVGGVDTSGGYTAVSSILQGATEGVPQGEFVNYQMTLFIYGEDEEAVGRIVEEAQRALSASQVVAVREGLAAESFFWGFMPGFNVLGRPWRVLSHLVSVYLVPQRGSEGVGRHDWSGHAVTSYPSAEGSRYRFCFHPTGEIQETGHVIVVGPAGGGKTTMLLHLAGQTLLRIPGSRVWLFDRFHGAEVFTRSMGGRYVRLEGVQQRNEQDEAVATVALNPLLMSDEAENRAFVRRWLGGLIASDLRPEDEAEVARAVTVSFDYAPMAHRTLGHLYYSAFSPGSEGRRQLARWVLDEDYSRVFSSGTDTMSELDSRLVAFDCTEAIENPLLASPVVSYLMHRIRMESMLKGDPALVVIDETEPLLADRDFSRFFRQGLQEGRKLRQVFVSCFQRPGAVERLGLGDLIRGQCPTAILFRNAAAQPEDYSMFDLTGAELDFVLGRSYQDLRRAVLVKRYEGRHTAILDTSLAQLGELLTLYSSSRVDVLRLRRSVGEFGTHDGVARYMKRG